MTLTHVPVSTFSGTAPIPYGAVDQDDLFAQLFQLADLVRPWAIRTAAALGVADHLTAGPRSVEELAGACGVEVRPLHAMLRFLATKGIFREVADGWFGLTPMAELLSSGTGASMRDSLVNTHEQRFSVAIGHLMYSLQTGRPAYQELFGENLFEFCGRDSEVRRELDDGFADDVSELAGAVSAWSGWSDVSRVVDVGGGRGELLAAVLGAHQHLEGSLLELEQVMPGAAEVVAAAGVADRCRLVAGDFFVDVPDGADCYLLSNVLLNWNDSRARAILNTCRRAMGARSRLLVIERVVPPGNGPDPTKYLDVHLLVTCGGMQRTAGELHGLIASSGFRLQTATPLAGSFQLLEALPIVDPAEQRR